MKVTSKSQFLSFTFCIALILLCLSSFVSAKDHVLVMTAGDYSEPSFKKLEGAIKLDAANARKLAQLLDYDASAATVLKERELYGMSIITAISKITQSIKLGDRLFLYFSGYGANLTNANDVCAEALIPPDWKVPTVSTTNKFDGLVTFADISLALKPVVPLLSDALIIFDVCNSGGLNSSTAESKTVKTDETDKGLGKNAANVRPSLFDGLCLDNDIVSNFTAATTTPNDADYASAGAKAYSRSQCRHITVVMPAKQNMDPRDDSTSGSLLTLSLLKCAELGVPVTSSIDQVTINDLVNCAQNYTEAQAKAVGLAATKPHWQVFFNRFKRLHSLRSTTNASANKVLNTSKLIRTLESIAATSNPNWGFTMRASNAAVKIGENFEIRYSLRFGGYLNLLYMPSESDSIENLISDMNGLKGNYRINPTSETVLYKSTVSGKAGANTFFGLITPEPLDVDKLLTLTNANRVNLSQQIVKNIQCLIQSKPASDSTAVQADPECRNLRVDSVVRNAGLLQMPVSPGGYGAVVFEVVGH
jgi:hypothetical protein